MPIEFQCSSCNKQLRVPETAIGKQAKCPGCQQVVTVPATSTTGAPPAPAGPPPTPVGPPPVGPPPAGLGGNNPYAGAVAPQVGANPYAAPTVAAMPRGPQLTSHGTGQLEATRAVSVAWMLFKEHAGVLIGSFAVIMFTSFAISMTQQVVQMVALQGTIQAAGPPGRGAPDSTALAILFGISLLFGLISAAVQMFFVTGLINLQLRIARGQQAGFGMLFSGGRWYLKVLLAYLLFGIIVGLGFLALIVPGFYLMLRYWSFIHFIVDRDCGIMESLKLAGEASKGNLGETFLLGLISFGLTILGYIMLCLGIFVTIPVIYLSLTIAYLMMTRQQFRQQPRGI